MKPVNCSGITGRIDNIFDEIDFSSMISPSIIRFARLSFECKITHPGNEDGADKIKREKELLLNVISYKFPISNLLKSTKERFDSQKKRERNKIKIVSKLDENEWKFGNVIHGNDYVFGKLAKITPKKEIIPDDRTEGFIETEHNVFFIANFFIDLKSHILAYEVKKDIGSISPARLIQDLFNSYYEGKEKITFIPITDRRKIIERIKKLKQITSVKIVLKIPNPHSNPLSKKFDELMRNWNASSTNLIVKSNKPLDIEANEGILISGLSLAEEGHGTAFLKNEIEKDGKIVVQEIQSYKYPIFKTSILPKEDNKKIDTFKQKITEVEESYSTENGEQKNA